jgi:hypothetical protein
LTFEQVARSFTEARLVVDDEAAQGHAPRIAAEARESMGASLEIDHIQAIAAAALFAESVTVLRRYALTRTPRSGLPAAPIVRSRRRQR